MKKEKKKQEPPTINREELMVGDWVMVKQYPTISLPKQMTNELFVRSLCEFRPIPLTNEFFEANCFAKQNVSEFIGNDLNIENIVGYDLTYVYLLHLDNATVMVESPKFNATVSISVPGSNKYLEFDNLKYVHELQHIFNLFGLKKEFVLPPTNKNM